VLPVGLSTFTTNLVTVDYSMVGDGVELSGGTLEFQPGEILKEIPVQISNPANYEIVRLTLGNPDHGELTGASSAFFVAPSTNPPPASTVIIPRGSSWKYLVTPAAPDAAWKGLGFADGGWPEGLAQLGYGDGDEATTIGWGPDANNKYATTYFRKTVDLTNPETRFGSLDLWLRRDDGGVVYLNGAEVFRSPNMPAGTITYSTRTTANGENTVDTSNFSASVLENGANVVAVEIHQADAGSSDISFDLELSGVAPPARPFLQWVWLQGELLLIWNEAGFILQSADDVDGPWTSVPGASSPWIVDPEGGRKFYQLLKN